MAKKKVNVELNMTPFIGLFALLVVMLLLTAVWNHISTLGSDTSSSTASSSSDNKQRVNLNVTILPSHLEMAEGSQGTRIKHLDAAGTIDTMRMVQLLNQWKDKYPERTDVILNTENSVTYNQLIVVFDTLVGNNWPDVGVNTQ